jgi:hypothetical protein
VDGARVVAYSGKLLRLRVVGVGRVENGVGGPYADVSIWQQLVSTMCRGGALRMSSTVVGGRTSGCRHQTRSIGRNVTAVDFKVFEIACMRVTSQHERTAMAASRMACYARRVNRPGCVNHCGLMRCMVACRVEADKACYYATMQNGDRARKVVAAASSMAWTTCSQSRRLHGVGDASSQLGGRLTLSRGLRFRCMRPSQK